MIVAILDSVAAIEALAGEWQELWGRTPGATPFQSPHWLLPWWAAFGTDAPRVVVVREGRRLVGVLPAYVLEEAGGRKVLPIGAGTSDYLDALGEGAGAMLAALLERAAAEGVLHCDLIEAPPGAGLCDAGVPPGWHGSWSEGSACPVLTLPDIPSGIRRKLRMSRHRADRAGGWGVERASAATLDGALGTLVSLHQARWAEGGEPGVLCDPAVLRFHREAGPGLLEAGLSRLAVLRVGGVVAAAILALLAPGQIFFYLNGYDTAQAFVSPGTLLLGAMLEEAVVEGRREAHFLRGREGYKYAWGAVDRMNRDGRFSRAV